MDRNSASGRDLEGGVRKNGVGEQGYFVRFLIGTAAQEGGRSERMVGRGPADDLHAKNVPVEFRRRRRVCGAQSNVVDTGVPTASLPPHGRLLGGPCFTTAQAGMQFNRHTDAPFFVLGYLIEFCSSLEHSLFTYDPYKRHGHYPGR